MNRAIARTLTRLHAPSWQRQYGCEFETLLADLPCTATLIADVVPRALVTRKQTAAMLAASLLLLCIAGSAIVRPHESAEVAVHADRHRPALAPCHSYSSVAQDGIVARQQCLD